MILHPNRFLQTAAVLLPIATAASIPIEGTWFASGVLLSGIFLVFNLFFWIRATEYLIRHVANGSSFSGMRILVPMKLVVLITCVTLCAMFFPLMSILIGNSVIIFSILIPSFYAAFLGSYTTDTVGASK
jgi:hypothetical protein